MSSRPQVLVVGESTDAPAVERLEDGGLLVECAATLEDATAAVGEGTFDCAASSESVPDGGGGTADGVDVLRAVREADPELPVVLFGPGRTAEADSAVTAGLVDYVPVADGGEYDALLGRVRNAVARRQAVRRAERQARMNEVIRDVQGALVRGDSREAIDESVCEQFVGAAGYTFAWIGAVDGEDLALRAMVVDGGTVEGGGAVSVDEGTAFTEPVHRAAEFREVVVLHDVGDRGGAWEAALDRPFSAVAAVPFVYEGDVYGVLLLYADRPGAFGEEERRVLAELGETIAYALNAVELRRRMALRERQLRRQNERLEEFASVVSHDLRNPINVARGYLEMADEEVRREVGTSLDRMETIIDDVLELARQGEAIEETAPTDLGALARRAWGNVDTDGADLAVADGDADDVVIAADGSRLVQLLENLFRNAIEHGDAGEVRVGPIREDGELVGFYVADDGPGVPDDERDRVLEMGYTTSSEGTGFGLAIVSEIADAHGWETAITDAAGGGARFEFTGVETP